MNEAFEKQASEVKWEETLKVTTVRYHTVGAWVAVVFNLVFGITDYINVDEHFEIFMIFRVVVSAIAGILLIIRKPMKLSADFLIFIPFLLISIQNAFMWSLMDAEHLQKHTMAYIALFIGAGMLVLWHIYWSVVVVILSIAANIIFLAINSKLGLEEIMANGGLLTGTVMIFSIILIQTRFNLNKKEIVARLSLEKSNKILNEQKLIIESKNENITSSLTYAKRIQDAILPPMPMIKNSFPESFVFYKPKDIVSGDFYWFEHLNGMSFIAAVDCTGHGVPGAFMSMIGNTILNKLVHQDSKPGDILVEMRKEIINTLEKSEETAQKDGMDIALCAIDHASDTLQYAGAFNPFYLFREGKLLQIKADRMPIGSYFGKIDKNFTNHTVKLKKGDWFYLFSDGFQDQIGFEADRKYSSKKFKSLLGTIHTKSASDQQRILNREFEKWKGEEEQLDDVLVIGMQYWDRLAMITQTKAE